MEPAAAWVEPCQFQLANLTLEEPAAGFPVEYASIDIPDGACGLQEYDVQQLLVEYYSAASGHNNTTSEKAKVSTKSIDSDVCGVFREVSQEFRDNMVEIMEEKMHRYPASLRGALHESYTVPRVVAIGPYHHHREHLKQAEKVKHMAAICCVEYSGKPLEEVYSEVVSAADDVRRRGLYDKDVMKGIDCDDFRHMMFFDACFMVQYMCWKSRKQRDERLYSFFFTNARDLNHDVILLENQLPWKVVKAVLKFMRDDNKKKIVSLRSFISYWEGYLLHHRNNAERQDVSHASTLVESERFKPHLLGLLRYYTVGKSSDTASKSENKKKPDEKKNEKKKKNKRSISISAIELAKIGITLKANNTMKLIDMGLNQDGNLLAELSLAPLALDRNRASFLLNMAALELCMVWKKPEDSAVCSYLLLLVLLVSRVEDVQELRARGLLQGGGGLTNKEAFRFFTSFQGLRFGRCYKRVMADIEIYKENRRMQTKLYAFFYNNKKIIAAVVTGIGAVGGIIGTLLLKRTGISKIEIPTLLPLCDSPRIPQLSRAPIFN